MITTQDVYFLLEIRINYYYYYYYYYYYVRGYETVSTRIRSGAIILSKLDIPLGCHTLDTIAVGLVTGLLDQLPNRGKFEKVIRCDTWSRGIRLGQRFRVLGRGGE